MALEYIILGYAAAAEAIMLVLLTMPGLEPLRKAFIPLVRSAMKPLLTLVPFSLFLLMDMYWKYESKTPSCENDHSCGPREHLRHDKSMMKYQRNALLIMASLVLYWLLFSVTHLLLRLENLNRQVAKLRNSD